ncbi:MAG: polyphosphate kinase 2 [Burkholderiales bacterium]|jgi:polyphosphate kinase 2
MGKGKDGKARKDPQAKAVRTKDVTAAPVEAVATKVPEGSNGSNGGLSRKDYEARLEPLEVELNRLARWVQATGQRLLVIFEGRDTAGKGGAISAISATLNPRQCHVVALAKPTEAERTQWYFQRYVAHLPAAGQIVLFDRSWYNRAGVERVMGWCTDAEYARFLEQAPRLEKMLVDDGILLVKYWLTVDQAQQEKRFRERLDDPLKRWKLSPIDLKSREKYAEYTDARDAMLEATHTKHAPWTLVDFNDQRRGRLTLIRDLLDRIPDTEVPPESIEFPPLPGEPLAERFRKGPKPIRPSN